MPRDQEKQEIYANHYAEDYHVEIGHGIEHLKIMKNLLKIVSTDDGMKGADPVMKNKTRDHATGIARDHEMIRKREIVQDLMTMLQEDSHLTDPDHGITHQTIRMKPTHGIAHAPEISHKNDMNVEGEVHHLLIKTRELWMNWIVKSQDEQERQYLKGIE